MLMRHINPKSLERLYADHRRMGIVYGVAIIIVTLVTTYLYTTSFVLELSSSSRFKYPAPGIENIGTQPAVGQLAPL